MAKSPWKLAAVGLTLALGLTGCGDTEDEAGAPEVEEVEVPAAEAPEGTVPEDDMPPDPVAMSEDEPDAPPTAAEEEAVPEEDDRMEPGDDIEADADTLGESPAAALDEGGALPGEPTRSDIDAILEDTERRFEEAQRRIDEQYEEVERDSPVLEPMDDPTEFRSTIEPMQDDIGDSPSAIDEEAERRGETTQSDIDAMLEETERRFEEARRQLDEQFEEAERSDPQSEAPQFDIED
ncbi:hypothetical protein [Billgrantia montanilacus]|uniref:Uncharacterized protein n=1 Tax=Billgrantia montanilacus TaxID=2282305 RepID=A0A368U744_9GAMM|nr:hypothetical protein [Halomonas montanilacus]RCV91922.1 hypothetical protein DU505_02320 [Halomonas montanilacus]